MAAVAGPTQEASGDIRPVSTELPVFLNGAPRSPAEAAPADRDPSNAGSGSAGTDGADHRDTNHK